MRQMRCGGLPGKHGDKHILFRGTKSAEYIQLFRRECLQTMRRLHEGRNGLRLFFGTGCQRKRRMYESVYVL